MLASNSRDRSYSCCPGLCSCCHPNPHFDADCSANGYPHRHPGHPYPRRRRHPYANPYTTKPGGNPHSHAYPHTATYPYQAIPSGTSRQIDRGRR